jgi:hypothetical protein
VLQKYDYFPRQTTLQLFGIERVADFEIFVRKTADFVLKNAKKRRFALLKTCW